MLHQLNAADGEDLTPPVKFMPPNGKPYALNLWNNVIYTTTAQGCGGNPNLVYAYDLGTRKVGTFAPGSGGVGGRPRPAGGAARTGNTRPGTGPVKPENTHFGQPIIGANPHPAPNPP